MPIIYFYVSLKIDINVHSQKNKTMKRVRNSASCASKNASTQEEEKGNVIIVDTNVYINDYSVTNDFIKDKNLLIVPKTVVVELDKLKKKPEVKHEARMASNLIYKYHKEGKLKILWSQNFSRLSLDKEVPDNQIIACLNHVAKSPSFAAYKKIKLVTDDTSMLILASSFFENNPRVEVERFRNIRIANTKTRTAKGLRVVKLNLKDYGNSGKIVYKAKKFPGLKENDGVILNENGELSLAYRKKKEIVRIPSYISASGIKSQNQGTRNWEQELLIAQLLDPEIKVVMASGGAGSGKTLLALAAALEKHNDYREIILTRPAILIGDMDRLGFLPGDLNQKMAEFMDPFIQNLEVIINENDKSTISWIKDKLSSVIGKNNSNVELLGYLRSHLFEFLGFINTKVNSIQYYKGRTYHKTFLIVDEAQDLSPIEIKQIITRMGRDSKVVFVGDLGQIDRRFLNAENSGLSYAMVKMAGNPMVGVVNLTHTVRSEVAAYAEKVL